MENVILLNKYIKSEADQLTKLKNHERFGYLLTVVLAEFICFNRRRCGETQYKTSLLFAKSVDKDIESALFKFEVKLANSVHRIAVRGKRGKKVDILF